MTKKVLFVCYANVGRSQVAEACFKTLSRHECDSAGIAVNERIAAMKLSSKKFKDYPNQSSVQYVRREFGLDIGEKERQQLIPEMIDTADLAIIIADKERWPVYLKEDGKILFWDIQDPAAWLMKLPTIFIDKCNVGFSNWSPRSGKSDEQNAADRASHPSP